jgi:hypothetical protein
MRPESQLSGGQNGWTPRNIRSPNYEILRSVLTEDVPALSANSQTKLAYSRSELAGLLGISTKSIQRLENRGQLCSLKALRKKIYPHREVMRFLSETA